MTKRQDQWLRRSGRDPMIFDKRPLSEIMNDYIPYEKWDRRLKMIRRAGFSDLQDFLKNGQTHSGD